MDTRLKLLDKLKLQLNGFARIGEHKEEGWQNSLPYFVFKCPIHGLVKNYTYGYSDRLECPLCQQEAQQETVLQVTQGARAE